MNEDMSEMFKKLSGMLDGKEMPQEMQNIFKNITSNIASTNNVKQNNSNSDNNINNTSFNIDSKSKDSDYSDVNQNQSTPEFDINMIMKMKTIMDSMKTNKNDPRANLLRSLKPYLNSKRKDKVDQYIQLFNMSKVFDIMNPLGGDSKNDI